MEWIEGDSKGMGEGEGRGSMKREREIKWEVVIMKNPKEINSVRKRF